MVAWGPIIGAGVSALGSLFGGSDDDEKTSTTIDYKKMAKKAEKAGFNPLTAIRNGGSAGFATTHHPALASGASGGFGEAFQTLGNAIMSFDARADERAQLEQDLLTAQIAALNRQNQWIDSARARMSFEVPSATGSTYSSKPGGGAAGNGVLPTPTVSGAENRTATNPFATDSGIVIDENVPDANAATNRYGEVGEIIFGINAGLADWEKNRNPPPITDAWVEPIRKEVRRIVTSPFSSIATGARGTRPSYTAPGKWR